MTNIIKNPFVNCTARDMKYSEVMQFWCSPFECYKIKEADLTSSPTTLIIEGARGSGKTMILKHQSFFCQKENYVKGEFIKSINEAGYLGVYFRYSANYSSIFEQLSCSQKYREKLFLDYFQLCISLEFCKVLSEIEPEIDAQYKALSFERFSELCGEKQENAGSVLKWLTIAINKQDEFIRNASYFSIDESYSILSDHFLTDFMEILHETIPCFSDVLFLIIIDEYENIGKYQIVINSLIKQTEGTNQYTFRIGTRPEGIRSYATNISGEFLQDGRDFINYKLSVSSADRTSKYSNFVKEVVNRRLHSIPLFKEANISIDDLLGKKENYDLEAKFLVSGRKAHFAEILEGIPRKDAEHITMLLSNDSPIVEAYYIMRVKRNKTIAEVIQMKEDLSAGKETEDTKKYKLDMQDKYKAALLFWLISKYGGKKWYYSFSTYLYLSCGSIYDFIGLCRTVFDELESDYFSNFEKNCTISPAIQTKAALRYAEAQLEKVKLNIEYGTQMALFAQNMCSLFSLYHRGDLCLKYPETNQFYVDGNFDQSGINKEIWQSMIKWGVVIRKSSYQRASLSRRVKTQLYYINKIYYPIFNISCRIRGGFNYKLTNEVWDQILVSLIDPESLISKAKRKESKSANIEEDIKNPKQLSLFDVEEESS